MEEYNKSLLPFSDDIQIDNIREEDRQLVEMKIWNFLGKHVERYTMGDSSSVPVETVEELLDSVCFSLGLELKGLPNAYEVLLEKDIYDLLKASWDKIISLMEAGKELLEAVRKISPAIENISYEDTLMEISEFFRLYDYRFFAHRINCSIDYQLSNLISEKLQGIEYINEYLKALLIENEFCKCFHKDHIIYLLNSYCPDYKGLLINIFEPVLTNTIGLEILGEDILTLDISAPKRKMLLSIFRNLSKAEILGKIKSSAKNICDSLGITDTEKLEYILKTAADIYPRIEIGLSQGNIDNIFLSFNYEDTTQESEFTGFMDNSSMDDEKLRQVINEIMYCRFISDKIAIVKQEIPSLCDLVEVLSACFWGDEALELFKTLSEDELYILNDYLGTRVEAYKSDSAWEDIFMDYLSHIK